MTDEPPRTPLTITSNNCEAMVGVSWKWIQRFAAEHGVPTWRVKGRRFVSASLLAQAMQRVASSTAPRTQAERVAQLKAEITEEIRKLSRTQ